MAGRCSFCVVLLFATLLGTVSCKKDSTPKPRGYFRIGFPGKSYRELNGPFPYNFLIPTYSVVTPDLLNPTEKEWITIEIPANHAQIHISYKQIVQNLPQLIEESRSLVYKHSQKASSIEEQVFVYPSRHIYGMLYTLKGNAASPMQFYLTDSVKNFLRGALYIKEVPNYDSLRPVITFLSEDVVRMVESTQWKKSDER